MAYAVLLATIVLFGCGGSNPAPAPATPPITPAVAELRNRCAKAITEAAKTGREGEQFSPEDQKLNAEVEATMVDGCAATQWSDVMLMCLTNGTSRDELKGCTEILTDAQRQDFMERVLAVTKAHEAAAKPAPAP